jgi:hypothetical protein
MSMIARIKYIVAAVVAPVSLVFALAAHWKL